MKYMGEMDKISGFEASVFGSSIIPEVVKNTHLLFPISIRRYGLVLRNNNQAEEYVNLDMFAEESNKLVGMLLTGKLSYRFFSHIRKKLNEGFKVLDQLRNSKMKNMQKLSDKALISLYGGFIKIYSHYFGIGGVTFIYESYLAEKLLPAMNLKLEKPEDLVFSYIDSQNANYKSYMIAYEQHLRNLSRNKSQKLMQNVLNAFYYIKSNYRDSKMLDEIAVKEDMKHLHRNTKKHKILPKTSINALLRKISRKNKTILEILARTLPLRDMRKKLNQAGQFILIRFLDEGLRRRGLKSKRKLFLKMFWFEYNDLIKNPKRLEKKLLKRKIATIGCFDGKVFYLERLAIKKRKPRSKEMPKGVIASRGKSRGIVKIVMGQSQFKKFEKGDILVSEATRPEFVPVMKKAAAIVTEEGGITSHAAIISRELKVPCIVGVSHITSILRDGDFVEVDANNGIIRILKK